MQAKSGIGTSDRREGIADLNGPTLSGALSKAAPLLPLGIDIGPIWIVGFAMIARFV